MPPNKTLPNQKSVTAFLSTISNAKRKEDAHGLIYLMEKITGAPPLMWGASIIGFGHYHYRYKSGREGDWFLTGFSPRKNALTLYLMCDLSHKSLDFEGLGNYKKSVGCLYIKSLDRINFKVLEALIEKSIQLIKEKYIS